MPLKSLNLRNGAVQRPPPSLSPRRRRTCLRPRSNQLIISRRSLVVLLSWPPPTLISHLVARWMSPLREQLPFHEPLWNDVFIAVQSTVCNLVPYFQEGDIYAWKKERRRRRIRNKIYFSLPRSTSLDYSSFLLVFRSIFLDFEGRCILRIVSILRLIGTRFRILCEFLRNSKLSMRLSIYYTFFDLKISKIYPRNSSCDAKIFFRRASRFFTAKIKNDQAFPIACY